MNLFGQLIANEIAVLPPELQNICQKTIAEIEQLWSQSPAIEYFCEGVAESIHRAFNLYSANLYIVDGKNGWAVLKAGTSKIAQEAKQKGHKFPIDDNSLIGTVVQTRQGQIMQEKQAQIDYYASPSYHPIHSELAMPIISSQDRAAIGVLDIQSDEYEAFGKDEYLAFSIIANCIALVFSEALPRMHS
jgi:transcriptional regulator with GAF, ATPase, and Fis domain